LGEGKQGDGLTFSRHKLDFKRLTFPVTMHYSTHISLFQTVFFDVVGENDNI
jgi:hypothetical protein